MRPAAREFPDQKHKAITLMGMSGVGKSHLAKKLAGWGWHNYSCDDLIGRAHFGVSDMGALSRFVGQIGDPEKGGLGLAEFHDRQQAYYEAECAVLRDMGGALAQCEGQHFVNDSAGSLCEVTDAALLEEIGRQTLFVYLKVAEENHDVILQRAVKNPKPLYFPPEFFDEKLLEYQEMTDAQAVEEIDPGAFLSWVFPFLFRARLPKYQSLADMYGVTLPAVQASSAGSAEEFIGMVAAALNK